MTEDDTQRILAAIERLEAKQDKMGGDITEMRGETRGDLANMRGDITEMRGETRGDLANMRGDLENMRAGIAKMRADIMERIDRLQHSVDLTRDEIVVNFGNTDRAERTARAAIDDNRITTDILRTMQRQIARLQTDVEQLKGPP